MSLEGLSQEELRRIIYPQESIIPPEYRIGDRFRKGEYYIEITRGPYLVPRGANRKIVPLYRIEQRYGPDGIPRGKFIGLDRLRTYVRMR